VVCVKHSGAFFGEAAPCLRAGGEEQFGKSYTGQSLKIVPTPPQTGHASEDGTRTFHLLVTDALGHEGHDYVTLHFCAPTGVSDATRAAPPSPNIRFALPNPSVGHMRLVYDLPAAGHARMEVFDVSGRRVALVLNDERPAGVHVAEWNGRADTGTLAPSGTYVARLSAAGRTVTRRFVLTR
jgi:hypothetical protein